MNLRAFFLFLVATTISWGTSAQAKCPGFSDADLSIDGTVIEHMKGAGMMKIKTRECGNITVGIPAQSKAELELYYFECEMGSLAVVEGDMIIGIMQAKILGCF